MHSISMKILDGFFFVLAELDMTHHDCVYLLAEEREPKTLNIFF